MSTTLCTTGTPTKSVNARKGLRRTFKYESSCSVQTKLRRNGTALPRTSSARRRSMQSNLWKPWTSSLHFPDAGSSLFRVQVSLPLQERLHTDLERYVTVADYRGTRPGVTTSALRSMYAPNDTRSLRTTSPVPPVLKQVHARCRMRATIMGPHLQQRGVQVQLLLQEVAGHWQTSSACKPAFLSTCCVQHHWLSASTQQ